MALLGGEPLVVDEAFIRLDVFGDGLAESAQMVANAWWAAMSAWACGNPPVRRFNHAPTNAAFLKPAALQLDWGAVNFKTDPFAGAPCLL